MKKIEIEFTEEEIQKLEKSAKAHKKTLDEFVKSIVMHSITKTSH